MKINVITIFPEIFEVPLNTGILGRAGRTGIVDINIYDLNGRKMKSVTLSNLAKGMHTMDFDCIEYPVGSYFIIVESMSFKKVAKFVKY